jgi:hypothetical protein
MKPIVCKLFVLLMVMGTLGVVDARAQLGGPEVRFTVSSSFVAGDASFPAGTYSITQEHQDDAQILLITDDSNAHSAVLLGEFIDSDLPHKKTEVIFKKYGNTVVLKQIWLLGQTTGYLVPRSYKEQEVAKNGTPTKQSVEATSK